MLKYVDVMEVFAEIPDEISLAIDFSNCPIRCKDCHSKYLWEDKGEFLTTLKLKELIKAHTGITCVCFMGGDSQPSEIETLASVVKRNFPKLKVAWYSGYEEVSPDISIKDIDYLKLGPYIKEKGPLTSKTTNQRFLRRGDSLDWEDVTYLFYDKSNQ